jgi:cell division protein FtsX
MMGVIVLTVDKSDKRSIWEYIKDMKNEQTTTGALVSEVLIEAVLQGCCNLDDNINEALTKIETSMRKNFVAG